MESGHVHVRVGRVPVEEPVRVVARAVFDPFERVGACDYAVHDGAFAPEVPDVRGE